MLDGRSRAAVLLSAFCWSYLLAGSLYNHPPRSCHVCCACCWVRKTQALLADVARAAAAEQQRRRRQQ